MEKPLHMTQRIFNYFQHYNEVILDTRGSEDTGTSSQFLNLWDGMKTFYF